MYQRTQSTECKGRPQNGRKYPECIENSCNSAATATTWFTNGQVLCLHTSWRLWKPRCGGISTLGKAWGTWQLSSSIWRAVPWKRDELVHQDSREQEKNQMACCGFGQRQEVPLRGTGEPWGHFVLLLREAQGTHMAVLRTLWDRLGPGTWDPLRCLHLDSLLQFPYKETMRD